MTPSQFHDLVETDLWVIQQVLTLPSDPPPRIEREGNVTHIHLVDTLSMPAQQKAVEEYRSRLLPAIFTLAQKVYAELFRLVLGNTGLTAGDRQADVENAIAANKANLVVSPPFRDGNDFDDWWARCYDFRLLRRARNQILHNSYSFDGNSLLVIDNDMTVLSWTAEDVIRFAQSVLERCRSISRS